MEETYMASKKELKLDLMWKEAVERLELMNAHEQERNFVLNQRAVENKIVVNHEERSVRRTEITEKEIQMIKKFEKEYGYIVYYLIEDEGLWPDGCTFKRYTMPYVSTYEEEYEMDKEDAIELCGTCPAYIVNMEEPDCPEITEFKFQNVGGLIINAS